MEYIKMDAIAELIIAVAIVHGVPKGTIRRMRDELDRQYINKGWRDDIRNLRTDS